MQTQYITDDAGKKVAVILSIDDYNRIIERFEDIIDEKIFEEVMAEGIGETTPIDDLIKELGLEKKEGNAAV